MDPVKKDQRIRIQPTEKMEPEPFLPKGPDPNYFPSDLRCQYSPHLVVDRFNNFSFVNSGSIDNTLVTFLINSSQFTLVIGAVTYTVFLSFCAYFLSLSVSLFLPFCRSLTLYLSLSFSLCLFF